MLAAVCVIAGCSAWIPARWGSGNPRSLELLSGAAVNALLIEPRHWNGAFVKAASARHLVTLGVIHPGDDVGRLAREAARLRMDGVVLEGDFGAGARSQCGKLVVIELPGRGKIRLDTHDPATGTSQALWPGIQIEHGGKVSMGPSSTPWIDTNTGFLRFLSAATEAPVWLGERPPRGSVFPLQRYTLAVADAAVANARWIVTLDDDLQKRLLDRDAGALKTWKAVNQYIRYFEDHPDWREDSLFSEFAVVQDVASGGMLSASLLDMLAALHKTARPVPTRDLDGRRLKDTTVVLNVDAAALDARQKEDLAQFAREGGKILNPPRDWRFPAPAPDQIVPTAKQVDAMQPLWEITYDATLRRNFGARTFNTSTIIFVLRASPDRKRMVLHLLNYADYASEDIAVQVLGPWKKARLYTPEDAPRDLPVYAVQDGTGVDVARIATLGTVVFE